MKKVKIRAIRTKQGGVHDVYSFFLPGKIISEVADISRMPRDAKDEMQGFQRKEIQNHVKAIVEYLDGDNVLFPNAIILALSSEVEFTQARGRAPAGTLDCGESGTLTIPARAEGERIAWIVDGQQRSLALSRTKNANLPVPVVAFVEDELETQREQFILVNKAKPLPTRLINELLPEVDTRLPRDLAIRKIPSELCNLLNRDPDSPFFGLIKRASTQSKAAVVSDTAVMKLVERSLGNPLGALSQYKGLGSEPSDIDGMYRVLILFWNTVKDVFSEDWGLPPTKSRLMHGAGLKSMGVLMDRLIPRAMNTANPKKSLKVSLKAISPHCCWTNGIWEDLGMEWNDIQDVGRHVKILSEQLLRLDHNYNPERRP